MFGKWLLFGTAALVLGCGALTVRAAKIAAVPNDKIVLNLQGNVNLEMVKIKAGSFLMGSPSGETGHEDDEKEHRVTLTKDFWLGKYEVTQGQWTAVMGYNPSNFRSYDRPVECVSWDDAMKFCTKLNKMGKAPAGYKFTLPTEAQWEYACRAGTKTSLNSGENMIINGKNDSPNLDNVGWYSGNCGRGFDLDNGFYIAVIQERQYADSRGGSHPVGRKAPNRWGLYDMHGNVWEWCLDRYEEGYAANPETLAGNSGSDRVCRGGGWFQMPKNCRSASRGNSGFFGNRLSYIGFRLALIPVQ